MKWTAILLVVLAMVVVTTWCAVLARVFGVENKDLAAWAQAVGSLVAVAAAIWAANHQTIKTRELDLERAAHQAEEGRERALRSIQYGANRLLAATKAGKEALDDGRMTRFIATILQSEYEATKSAVARIDPGILSSPLAEELFKLDVMASMTSQALRSYLPSRPADQKSLDAMLRSDIDDLKSIIKAVHAARID